MVTVLPPRSWLQTKLGFNRELREKGGVVEGSADVVVVLIVDDVVEGGTLVVEGAGDGGLVA
ncbi:MAG: hypothetical protein ABWJ97_02505 [Thermoproteus sp.]